MYRHEFRKNFAMMQPPKMHEICPRGTKNEKKSNEQKLISIFHFLPNFRISREWLISLNEKKKIPRNLVKPIFKCFPLIGVDFAHNPSSPYHLGEVRSVPCYKYARGQYLARASLARPNTKFRISSDTLGDSGPFPFCPNETVGLSNVEICFCPSSSSFFLCLLPPCSIIMTHMYDVICGSHWWPPCSLQHSPALFIFSLLTTVEPCPMFHFHVCANRTNPDIFDPFGLIQIVTWFSLTPIVSSPLKLVFQIQGVITRCNSV